MWWHSRYTGVALLLLLELIEVRQEATAQRRHRALARDRLQVLVQPTAGRGKAVAGVQGTPRAEPKEVAIHPPTAGRHPPPPLLTVRTLCCPAAYVAAVHL